MNNFYGASVFLLCLAQIISAEQVPSEVHTIVTFYGVPITDTGEAIVEKQQNMKIEVLVI